MLVSAEERQFSRMTCSSEPRLVELRKHGLYVFRFFKAGCSYFVLVDDLLPTRDLPNGRPVPVFARCQNPNLFWISLAEKAYAKLHGRYFALEGGCTDEALEDFVGSPVENCFIDTGMTHEQLFTEAMKVLASNHAVLGLKIDLEMFKTDMKKEDQLKYSRKPLGMSEAQCEKHYNKARSMGLVPFHTYSVLDVRTIQDASGNPVSLIRMQNPWANGPEWQGPCCDSDKDFWTLTVKDRFNDLEEGVQDDRFKHQWFLDDGIFCMRVQDVLEYFTVVVAQRDYPENFFGVEYDQQW